MLQRIYGTAWSTQAELDAYLRRLEEAAQARPSQARARTRSLLRSRKTPAADSCSGIPRARSCAASSKTSSARACASAAISQSSRRTSSANISTRSPGISRTSRRTCSARSRSKEQRFRLKPMNCPGHILIYRSEGAFVSRSAAALLRVRHGLSLRTLRDAARAHARARLHARRRASLLHARSTARRVRADADEALRLMKAFGFEEFEYFLSTREDSVRVDTDEIAEDAIRKALGITQLAVRGRRRRRRVLRPEARHQRARRDRPQVAARHRAGRFRTAQALRSEVPRPRRPGSSPGHDPSRAWPARWNVSSAC